MLLLASGTGRRTGRWVIWPKMPFGSPGERRLKPAERGRIVLVGVARLADGPQALVDRVIEAGDRGRHRAFPPKGGGKATRRGGGVGVGNGTLGEYWGE